MKDSVQERDEHESPAAANSAAPRAPVICGSSAVTTGRCSLSSTSRRKAAVLGDPAGEHYGPLAGRRPPQHARRAPHHRFVKTEGDSAALLPAGDEGGDLGFREHRALAVDLGFLYGLKGLGCEPGQAVKPKDRVMISRSLPVPAAQRSFISRTG